MEILDDKFNLNRFVAAQAKIYAQVLLELKSGKKQSHWMWFIFPQIEGLGQSLTSKQYAITGIAESEAYLNHPLLGTRLVECTNILISLSDLSAEDIFGFPDDLKLKSSMTLFSTVSEGNPVFTEVLDKYFGGVRDEKTLLLLNA